MFLDHLTVYPFSAVITQANTSDTAESRQQDRDSYRIAHVARTESESEGREKPIAEDDTLGGVAASLADTVAAVATQPESQGDNTAKTLRLRLRALRLPSPWTRVLEHDD
jgi:hypothetical protein